MSDGASHRTDGRLGVQLPVRVQGIDPNGDRWHEMTVGEDITAGGASFKLQHLIAKGQAVILSLPLPARYRKFDHTTPSYRVFALIRQIESIEGGGHRVGVMFIGKTAPAGFDKNPNARYLLPGEDIPVSTERRVEQRFTVFLMVVLRRETNATGPLEEQTVAENLSRSGARVPTTLPAVKGEIVWVEEIGGDFRTRAEVRNVSMGKNGITRLNLKFLDEKVPERLISR